MRVSTRGRYALRAMLDLALHADEGPVLRQDIVARQGFSADYVAQLFRQLLAADLVKSVRGPGGGYVLARDPATISAGDVVRAVEGPIAISQCVIPGNEHSCRRMEDCVTHLLWKRLSVEVSRFLDAVTVQDLCDQAKRYMQRRERGDGKDLQ